VSERADGCRFDQEPGDSLTGRVGSADLDVTMTEHAPPPGLELAQAITEARTVAEVRQQDGAAITPADRWSSVVLGGGYVVAVIVLALGHGPPSGSVALTLVAFAAAHALASRVVFESAGGLAVATQPTLVASLLVLPVEYVPLVVLIGLVSSTPAAARSRHELLVRSLSGWHCIGPVVVLWLAAPDGVSLRHWPVYAVALLAQFVLDAATAVIRCLATAIPIGVLPRPMAWSWAVDALLTPIGIAAVLAADGTERSIVIALCPVGILALLGRDRTEHLEKAVAISEAFEAAVAAARIDPVTGIANRRAWNEATAHAALRFAANPMGRSVTVVLADVDGLKRVNDTIGHDAGDELIRAAARALTSAAPPGALVARVGGDEFGMLVADRSEIGAEEVVQRIRGAAAAQSVHGVQLSLSVGGASCPPYADVEAAQAAADERAMADKARRRAGR
jgi:diguanylate cyclase (GGDEF)-like protein